MTFQKVSRAIKRSVFEWMKKLPPQTNIFNEVLKEHKTISAEQNDVITY